MQDTRFRIKKGKVKILNLPLTKQNIFLLKAGDMVLINGTLITGRDRVHKYLFNKRPSKKELPINIEGTILYHCGPIVRKTKKGFELIAGGPTTSMRVEMYEHQIISGYGLGGIMGKGGMGKQTLNALKKNGSVYFHTIGGAAVYLADRVKRVVDVWKLEEFGATEAMWVLEVEEFPAIVTMDAHGGSLHEEIENKSFKEFKRLLKI
jgi:tartrate/fumarate subfamily iron-sulfur-dependent hydro-lyase beta chain